MCSILRKADRLKAKTKAMVLGSGAKDEEEQVSQKELHDAEEERRERKKKAMEGLPSKERMLAFARFTALCVSIYLLGYFSFSVFLILVPIVMYIVYQYGKALKRERVREWPVILRLDYSSAVLGQRRMV